MQPRRAGRERMLDPGVARRTERYLAAERRIAFVAHVLDDLVAVPGTRSRVGLDPIIGLVPFLGDVVAGLVSAWIVLEATRFGLPRVVVARMVVNAVVDFGVGLIPLVGDLVDFGFKGNRRNLELLHRYATDPDASTAPHAAFLAGLLLVLLGAGWLTAVLVARLIAALLG